MLVPGGFQFLIASTCFAWRPVHGINKSHVILTARACVNCNINAWLLFINKRLLISCDTGIYAIIDDENHLAALMSHGEARMASRRH